MSESSLGVKMARQPNGLAYLQLFWAKRKFLLKSALYAGLASILTAFLIPVRYESIAHLMPPDQQSGLGLGLLASLAGRAGAGSGGGGSAAGGLAGFAGDLLGIKTSGSLFVGVLGSETVQDAVINKFKLQKVYQARTIEDARKDLEKHTEVSEDPKSGIISITVTDHDRYRAAAMGQAYVAELDRVVALVSTSSARRERIFLEERLQNVKTELDTAAKEFSDFASKNTAIDIPAQGKAMVEAAASLQGELIAAQAQVSGLRQIYTENNVRLKEAEARVNELQKKLNEMGGSGTPDQIYKDDSLYPSIRKLPLLGVTYADLYRRNKIEETVYELLTQQYELAKVEEAKEIPSVKVLDPPLVPTKKSFPPRFLIVLLGLVLDMLGCMAFVIAKARWEAVDITDPRKLFAIEVFTSVQTSVVRLSHRGLWPSRNGRAQSALWKPDTAVLKEHRAELAEGDLGRAEMALHSHENDN